MLRLIKIYGNKNKDRIDELMRDRLYSKGLEVIKNEEGTYPLEITINTNLKEIDHIIYRELADFLEDVIIDVYLDKTIKKRISKIYMGEKFEEDVIYKIKSELKTSYTYIEEKIEIRKKLSRYLEENENIFIDGYIQFRLNDYLYIIDTAIDGIISEIKESEKLEEFIEIIQHFVSRQKSKIDYLNVILKNYDFVLKDMYNKVVGTDIVEQVQKEFRHEAISRTDTLLSTLIIIAPKRLVVHSKKEDSPLINLIKDVFGDKFVYCGGCNICDGE